MMKTIGLAAAALLGAIAVTPADATVTYTYLDASGTGFSLVTPDFLNLQPADSVQFVSGDAGFTPINGTSFGYIEHDGPGTFYVVIEAGSISNGHFQAALDQVGSYNAITGEGTFTISQVADVPEPAMWLLMTAGFGLVGTALRRRAATVAATA